MSESASSTTMNRIIGGIQLIGGALEVTMGGGAMLAPTGVSQVGGIIVIAHGADTLVAGFETLRTGQVNNTLTQRAAAGAARGFGASPQTAEYIGTGADVVAGVGPSIGVSVTRRLAIAGAQRSSTRVAVAYLHRSALEMGHNAVGIRQGSTTAWYHFSGVPHGSVGAASPPGARYVVTELAISVDQARRADAARRTLMAAGTRKWGWLAPNCTTTALSVLQEAGIVVPLWSRSPMLLHIGLNAGAEISVVGGTVAATAPALAPRPPPPPFIRPAI